MTKYIKILIAFLVISIPFFIWFKKHRPIHPQEIINQLHIQFENVSFISIDYQTSTRKLLGMNCEVYTGALHVKKAKDTERYQFIADAFTGEIIEITSL
ncbi:hypothetical protein [Salinicoccus sp. HZC-1]|uniref:hypothetical protein n=1 Tax=Salinicoccus sp. HZC-1 TaxID=3385497 RepID=UPI00398BB1EE